MKIRKQPIISWLLERTYVFDPAKITIIQTNNSTHVGYLYNGMAHITDICKDNLNWGLPELLMPSFEKVMKKSAKSFYNFDHQLFQNFYNDNECGILLHKELGTIVYVFGDNTLYVWLFKDMNGISVLYNCFYLKSTEKNTRQIYASPTLLDEPGFRGMSDLYSVVGNLLITYLAVKKYAKVETIIVPDKAMKVVEDTIDGYKHKEMVKNESGQEVIIMDSRWFVKIINDNDIHVRGYFRLQPKKNEFGEWCRELRYIDSHVRHGYHRNAKIEETENYDTQKPLQEERCEE